MKRIIIHHTGGTYKPNQTDRNAYHILIDNVGTVHYGTHKISDNEDCTDGNYAAHTLRGNTGSIGIAACCNYNFNTKTKQSPYPITIKQFENICRVSAKLMKEYNIKLSEIYTHWGFDKLHNIHQGKIDIIYLPWKPQLAPAEVQQEFRTTIMKYYRKEY